MGSPSDRTVGLVLVAVLLAAGLWAIPDPDVVSTDRRPSTHRSSPSGLRALYLTLDELGVPVARRLTPLAEAEPVPEVLALVAPTEPLSPREVGALVQRIRGGGALLYVARQADPLLDTLSLELVPWWELVASGADEVRLRELLGAGDVVPGDRVAGERPWVVRPLDHAWTRELEEVIGFRWAFTAGEGAAPRPLLADDSLLFALTLPLGEGRVVALSDARPLTNEWIREAGVAPLVARAAHELTSGGRTLVFDEYHHGFRGGSVREGIAAFLAGHPVGNALLQLGTVVLLTLLAAGRRFGAPRTAPVKRRSPLEHVEALARAYRESGARRLPRLQLLAGLARHARRARPRDDGEARALLAHLRTVAPGAGPALDRLERGLGRPDDDLLAMSAAADRVAEELRR